MAGREIRQWLLSVEVEDCNAGQVKRRPGYQKFEGSEHKSFNEMSMEMYH